MNKSTSNFVAKFCAFTLAETLIVMGIIGIVSALTLPNLNSSTGEKEKVAKVKKLYQNLTDAQARAVAVYGPVDTWFLSDTTKKDASNRYADRIMEFMKVSKDCNQSVSGCFVNKNYYELSGKDHGGGPNTWPDDRKFKLADGTSISLSIDKYGTNACTSTSSDLVGDNKLCGSISVDIDGIKGKNAYGIDFFQFVITKDDIVPCGLPETTSGKSLTSTCFTTGGACAAWIIMNDNMDYYSKATKGVCKNNSSKTLSWDNTTCK